MIIGLTGKYQSGKDTIADHLVDKYGFRKVGFSDQLYEALANFLGISVEDAHQYKDPNLGFTLQLRSPLVTHQSYSWREVLQRFGTEMGRNTFGKDFWVDEFIKKYLMIPQNLVVRDVRFDNEAHALTAMEVGAHIWEVTRPGFEGDAHASEAGIHEAYVTADINNNGTIEELHELIDKAMTEVYGFDPQ